LLTIENPKDKVIAIVKRIVIRTRLLLDMNPPYSKMAEY
jgi:hypothetical protein